MFIRRDRKCLTFGEKRVHVSFAHNVREQIPDGSSQPKSIIFARFGPADDLDANTVVQMRDALDRYLRKPFGNEVANQHAMRQAADEVAPLAPSMCMLASRACGMRVVVEHVHNQLGLKRALAAIEAKTPRPSRSSASSSRCFKPARQPDLEASV